jgi:hypothetical protein
MDPKPFNRFVARVRPAVPLAWGRRRAARAEQAVEHEVERHVPAVAEAEHLDVVDGDVVEDVNVPDLDVRVGEGLEPAAVELDAGRLALAASPARRREDDVVGEHLREPVDVVSVEPSMRAGALAAQLHHLGVDCHHAQRPGHREAVVAVDHVVVLAQPEDRDRG